MSILAGTVNLNQDYPFPVFQKKRNSGFILFLYFYIKKAGFINKGPMLFNQCEFNLKYRGNHSKKFAHPNSV